MDNSDENSIVKWGKMGASLNRLYKQQAIGCKPPFLVPFFGMFGYGGPIASMNLGSCVEVSSKTKQSKKVYKLRLAREALLGNSGSECSWNTDGGIRDPLDEEIKESPHGSFTKVYSSVVILNPVVRNLDISKLQCKLKDIYFPYIQGTAGVALAGLLGTVRAQGRSLDDFPNHKIVVVGAGSAGLGVLSMAVQAVVRMTGNADTAAQNFFLLDKDIKRRIERV
ncbi:hypothetical protein V6Z11_D11G283500 [Gossypium hirsutum]